MPAVHALMRMLSCFIFVAMVVVCGGGFDGALGGAA